MRRRLLLDRDRRRQAFDQIDVRLFHELQELPCVGRERLDITALALGVERVERERTLARAGKTRDNDQPVPRQIEIDILEIVRACAANADVFHAGAGALDNLLIYSLSVALSKPICCARFGLALVAAD